MAINKDDGELFADRVNNFLLANRKIILAGIAVILVVVIGLAVYFSLSYKKKVDDVAVIEKMLFDLDKEKEEIEKKKQEEAKKEEEKEETEVTSENNVSSESTKVEEGSNSVSSETEGSDVTKDESIAEDEKIDPEILAKEDEVIPELEKLAEASDGYASYLAFYNVADMYFTRKDYHKARDYYEKALRVLPSSYVSGVLLFNIAVCIEEIGEDDGRALEYYEKSSQIEDFPLKPRAIFNVARLQEKLGKDEDAIVTYNSLMEKYPDNDFAMIGKSRVIALEIKMGK